MLLYGGKRDTRKPVVISDEVPDHLLIEAAKPPQFSPSVTKQNDKSEKIYLHFAAHMGIEAYPLTDKLVIAFLIWRTESHRLSARSIDQVIFPTLCRLNIVRVHTFVDSYV